MKKKSLLAMMIAITMTILMGCGSKTNNANSDNDSTIVADDVETPKESYGVDLGLSVNWAECNVGAESQEDMGVHVPLGNVEGTTKAPTTIRENVSGTDADIAKVVMGNGWRMPTGAEMQELLENCEWTVDIVNGKKGFRVTGKNGNSIFLPNSGSNFSTEAMAKLNNFKFRPSNVDYEGNYWCGTPTEGNIGCNHLTFNTDEERVRLMWCNPIFCCAVRAVHKK